jgi:hypothetical protein
MDKVHPNIEFATRHLLSLYHTSDAATAVARAEELLNDLDELEGLTLSSTQGNKRWRKRSNEFEIVSYYTVGFVTCLEWHARSRIVDLFTHSPKSIQQQDFDTQLGKNILTQMVSANLTIPQLLGVMKPVGSAKAYMEVFERVFRDLNLGCTAHEVVKPLITGNPMGTHGHTIEELFGFRHALVHEITVEQVGAYYQRHTLSISAAREFGVSTRDIIRKIEETLSRLAPSDFPNLLAPCGSQIDENERLDQQITDLEDKISENLLTYDKLNDHRMQPSWIDAEQACDRYLGALKELIFHAPFLHNRHVDLRRPLRLSLRRGRLEFLKLLNAEVEEGLACSEAHSEQDPSQTRHDDGGSDR